MDALDGVEVTDLGDLDARARRQHDIPTDLQGALVTSVQPDSNSAEAGLKPIVVVKSGRSQAGARAASSHTGSMASVETAVSALFRQTGMIRTDTLQELFEVASLLANQPLPRGRRVGVLTNAGGKKIALLLPEVGTAAAFLAALAATMALHLALRPRPAAPAPR